jgi:hypothetical protein
MNFRTLAFALLLLVGVRLVSGGVTMELVSHGTPTDGTTTATGYTAFTIRLVSDFGNISAVDADSSGGISGPLVQRWLSSAGDGVYDRSTPGWDPVHLRTRSPLNFDSHFYEPPDLRLAIMGPVEDAVIGAPGDQLGTLPVNTLDVGYGLGNNLTVVLGIPGAFQSPTYDLAYVVIPNTGTITLHGWAAVVGQQPIELNSARAWSGAENTWNTDPTNRNWRCWGSDASFEDGTDVQFTNAGLSGGGVVNVHAAGVAPHRLTFSNTNGTYTISGGPIHVAERIEKRGAGAVVFNSPVETSSALYFDRGTVEINDTFSSAGLTTTNLTLSGSGTITGQLKPRDSTIIAPGPASGLGTLTVDRIVSNFSTKFQFKVGPTGSDRLVVTQPDGFLVNSGSRILFNQIGDLAPGTYTLIDYAGAPVVTMPGQSKFTVGPFVASLLNNTTNTSIDVQLIAMTSWRTDGGGSWSSAGNWDGAMPNSKEAAANFGTAITSPATVLLDSNKTARILRFDSPIPYTIGGGSTLTISGLTSSTPTLIEVASGSHTISSPLSLNGSMTIDVGPASSQLTLSGQVVNSSRFTKIGAGTLSITGASGGFTFIDVQSGTLTLHAQGKPSSIRVSTGAVLAGDGTIDSSLSVDPRAFLVVGVDPDVPATLSTKVLQLGDSFLEFDITSSGADRIDVTGLDRLQLNGKAHIIVGGSLHEGVFTLIDYQGVPLADLGKLILDPFNGPATLPLALRYNSANTSIDLLVGDPARIPEPAWLLLFGCIGMLTRHRRAGFSLHVQVLSHAG